MPADPQDRMDVLGSDQDDQNSDGPSLAPIVRRKGRCVTCVMQISGRFRRRSPHLGGFVCQSLGDVGHSLATTNSNPSFSPCYHPCLVGDNPFSKWRCSLCCLLRTSAGLIDTAPHLRFRRWLG